jgi:hypothetical protein
MPDITKGGLMEYIRFNKKCAHCGDELDTENTTKLFIKDKKYICFDCVSEKATNIDALERIYDPWQDRDRKKSQKQFATHEGLLDRLIQSKVEPEKKQYPDKRGKIFKLNGKELQCPECKIVLTTANAKKSSIDTGRYICKSCMKIQREQKETDPLYDIKMEIKSLLLALHSRRRVIQFTWEYIEKRFAAPAQVIPIIYEQSDYESVAKLFGTAYAEKVFAPQPIILQQSFGDLSTEEGCRKLLTLFQWELQKSRRRGLRNQEAYIAAAWAKTHDRTFDQRSDPNIGTNPDDYSVTDSAYETYYYGNQCEPKRDCTYEEIQLSDETLPDVLSANESQKKQIEIKRQQLILTYITEETEIFRQKKTIVRLYEDLRGHENMNWNDLFDNLRFLEYETPEEFR